MDEARNRYRNKEKKLLGIFSDENMKEGKKEGRERMREED